jgi:ribonuclease BN (tRNA processing enzyme)
VEFRVLGGHQADSTEGRPISFLIDGKIAIDAGGLTGALSMAEQGRVDHVVLTHQHYDHIRDLAFLGLGALVAGRQVEVHCTHVVHDLLRQTILNNAIWLDFFIRPDPNHPTFVHRPIEAGHIYEIGGHAFKALDNRHHSVPVVGYEVTAASGKRLLYTGDTGPGIREIWPHVQPDVLITEVTYPNAQTAAADHGHLTAALAELELAAFRDQKGYLPRILICHPNQSHEQEIAAEVAEVARHLQAVVEITHEGLCVSL